MTAQAIFAYTLKASTGYECSGQIMGVTPEQWGQIVAAHTCICNRDLMHERFEAWAKSIGYRDLTRKGDEYTNPSVDDDWHVWLSAYTFIPKEDE